MCNKQTCKMDPQDNLSQWILICLNRLEISPVSWIRNLFWQILISLDRSEIWTNRLGSCPDRYEICPDRFESLWTALISLDRLEIHPDTLKTKICTLYPSYCRLSIGWYAFFPKGEWIGDFMTYFWFEEWEFLRRPWSLQVRIKPAFLCKTLGCRSGV